MHARVILVPGGSWWMVLGNPGEAEEAPGRGPAPGPRVFLGNEPAFHQPPGLVASSVSLLSGDISSLAAATGRSGLIISEARN